MKKPRLVDEHEAAGKRIIADGQHRFEGSGEQTRMVDTVHYALPLGPIGRVVHRFVVAPTLRRIFGFRRAAIAFRFGLRRVAGRSAA